MDYGNLFTKAWEIIWKNKFLIILGVLIALGGAGSGSGGGQGQFAFSGNDFNWEDLPQFGYGTPFQDLDLSLMAAGVILFIMLVFIVIGLAFWVLGTIARGALINGVNEIELGNPTNFSETFRAGWNKGWKLIGIGLIPAIPGVILLIIGVTTFLTFGGMELLSRDEYGLLTTGIIIPLVILACVLIPISMLLSLLRTFANRACMLEDHDVFSAYKRGFEVLGDNLGPALILFLIQMAISIGIGIMLLIPGILIALCCLLWPVFILIEAAFTTYYSTLWTLAWNEWVSIEDPAVSDN